MGTRKSKRYRYVLVALLFAAAGVVATLRLTAPAPPVPGKRPEIVPPSFPSLPAALLVDPEPTAAEGAKVDALVVRLGATDADAAEAALTSIEQLPYADLPLLEGAAARPDLPPASAARLGRVMPRVRLRDALARHRSHERDLFAAFYEQQALPAYVNGERSDPKWDANAEMFLHLANVRYALRVPAASEAIVAQAQQQLKIALDAGCEDVTVLACAALLAGDAGGAPDAVAELWARADRAGSVTVGGPLFRAIIDGRMLRQAGRLDDAARRKVWPDLINRLNAMCHNIEMMAALPGAPPSVVDSLTRNEFDRSEKDLHLTHDVAVHDFLAGIEKRLPDDPGLLTIKGQVYTAWAREALGGGTGYGVTPQGRRDFADRLAVAHAALERAWTLDPSEPTAARAMLTVLRGQNAGASEFDTWFDRAMAADPDDADACRDKLGYLAHQRGAGPEQMIRFGRQCLRDGNWASPIPTVLTEAHAWLADRYSADPAAYWLLPGVWDDVRLVYEGYTKRFPDNVGYRNGLARYAVLCHQWKVADEQFKTLGDNADPAPFGNGSAAALAEARATAARLAGDPAAQGR
jgi:hypothetical protein